MEESEQGVDSHRPSQTLGFRVFSLNLQLMVLKNGMTKELTPQECVKEARHVTWVGFWCNAALGAAKIVAGVFASSSALIADGIHSFSDFVSDVIVLAMVGIARKAGPQTCVRSRQI